MSALQRLVLQLVAPLASRVKSLVRMSWIEAVDDSKAIQVLDVEASGGDRPRAERFQEYGFSSVPLAGAQAIVLAVNSNRSQPVIVATDDRSQRPTNLQPGDVALYNDQGSIAHLGRNGQFLIAAGGTLTLQCGTSRITLEPDRITIEAAAVEIKQAS